MKNIQKQTHLKSVSNHLATLQPCNLATLLLCLLLAGCANNTSAQLASANVVAAMSGPADEGFARAYEPIEFEFPLDHGPHPRYQTEWWYYTGNLASEDGTPYGYQFTIFRSALTPEATERVSSYATNQIYMAHFALTDLRAKEHFSFERYSRGASGLAGASGDPSYKVWLEDWQIQELEAGRVQIQASADHEDSGPIAIDLQLNETRAPLLHGNRGLSQKGLEAGNASYYYSLVGLETTGTVTSGSETVAITGMSWMDHEFGTSALSRDAVGWDWFSIQLDNDSPEKSVAMMFAQIRNNDGSESGNFEGTIAYGDGRQQKITSADFSLEVQDTWTSPRTEISYPSQWQVKFPALDIELTLRPILADQEMKVSFVYYEGAIEVVGEMAGEPVTGRGYVELTGYGQ